MLRDLRVWWSDTDAHEEYEDALLAEIAGRNDGRLPFANLAGSDGQAKAERAREQPHGRSGRGTGTTSCAPSSGSPRQRLDRTPTPRLKGAAAKPAAEPTQLTAEGLERLTAELDNLRTNVRPEVIARVKSARELGDLKENGDYEYARKEQSFVEGRIQAIENLLRNGVVVDDAPAGDGAGLGSTVTVEADGERLTFMLVGSAEANAGAGRISNISPVGRALMGARAGDEVTVQLPNTVVIYPGHRGRLRRYAQRPQAPSSLGASSSSPRTVSWRGASGPVSGRLRSRGAKCAARLDVDSRSVALDPRGARRARPAGWP